MKKLIIIVSVVLSGNFLFAGNTGNNTIDKNKQTENYKYQSLFGSNAKAKGFGSLHTNIMHLGKNQIAAPGISGGIIIDQKIAIGLGGYGFFKNDYLQIPESNEKYNLEGSYGGIIIEPIIGARKMIHLTFPILFGNGTIAYRSDVKQFEKNNDNKETTTKHKVLDRTKFLMIEPKINAEINLSKNILFGIGVSYRHTSKLDLAHTSTSFLNGFNTGFSLRLGNF